jgi:hypothetical protein
MSDKRSVDYWHNKSEEARVIAETMRNETTRQIMLEIAADFERFAALERESLTQRIIEREVADLRKVSDIVDLVMD